MCITKIKNCQNIQKINPYKGFHFKMHVGKKCIKEICPELHVDGWTMKTVEEIETGLSKQVEEHSGLFTMEEVNTEKYLGDIISSDGKNLKNFINRRNKGTCVVNQIMTKLEEVCFGHYYFQVAVIWSTYQISSLLTNAEAWYNVTQADIEILESVDENLLRRIL